tara:strand:+ start:9663 stop:11348 length:1686 start_codon:yes stop_codon:yes gene_type:complete
MEILHNLVQGSDAWLAIRLSHFTASEAAIMMGASKHMSRDDLLTYKTTQIEEEVGYFTQKIYDKGHEVEALARPIAERILGEELYPVTGALMVEGLPFLASFDGLTMMEDTSFEHKQWNKEKAKTVEAKELEPEHYWQLEQQLLVSGAEKSMFVMSDGTEENMVHMFYKSVPERRDQLIAGWKQFQKDLENYEPTAYAPEPEAEAIMDLPALTVQLVGQVKESNLVVYQKTAMEFIESINTDLQTDQDFVNAEKMVKFCDKTEKELELVKKQSLSQTADIDLLFRTVDTLKEAMRSKRLELSKIVKSKKELIRTEIIMKANKSFSDDIQAANTEASPVQLPGIKADFAGALKGKKTVKSLNEAVNDELARVRIEINSAKEHILHNLEIYKTLAEKHAFLFNDLQQIIMKDSVDFTLLLESRIDKHEQAEAERIESDRQRIQAEEEAKAKAKVEAELKAKQEQEAKAQADLKAKQDAEPSRTVIGSKPASVDKSQNEIKETLETIDSEVMEVIRENNHESDIVSYLYTEFGLYAEQSKKIAHALMLGRVPHINYVGEVKKAA